MATDHACYQIGKGEPGSKARTAGEEFQQRTRMRLAVSIGFCSTQSMQAGSWLLTGTDLLGSRNNRTQPVGQKRFERYHGWKAR